jgi:hypothetical protein
MNEKPTREDKRLARIAADVFKIPKKELNDQKIIELANGVRDFFKRIIPKKK